LPLFVILSAAIAVAEHAERSWKYGFCHPEGCFTTRRISGLFFVDFKGEIPPLRGRDRPWCRPRDDNPPSRANAVGCRPERAQR